MVNLVKTSLSLSMLLCPSSFCVSHCTWVCLQGVTGREIGEVIVIHSCSSNLLIYSISFSELVICPGSFLGQHSLPTHIYFEPACQQPSHKCHKHVCDCHHTAADDTPYLICALWLRSVTDHLKREHNSNMQQRTSCNLVFRNININPFFVCCLFFDAMALKPKGVGNPHPATCIEVKCEVCQSVIAQFLE